jgi:hypothetical protein
MWRSWSQPSNGSGSPPGAATTLPAGGLHVSSQISITTGDCRAVRAPKHGPPGPSFVTALLNLGSYGATYAGSGNYLLSSATGSVTLF